MRDRVQSRQQQRGLMWQRWNSILSTRIKDAGIAIRHSREDILFLYCRLWKWVGGMWALCDIKLTPRKRHIFLIEKYIEDVKQDEKHVPNLLEAIIRSPGHVKDELRPILFKMDQFGSKIKKIKVSTFWIREIRSFRAAGQHNLLAQ